MTKWVRLVGIALLLTAIIAATVMESGAGGVRSHPLPDEPTDFISFNGAVYLSSAYQSEADPSAPDRPLDAQDLGPVVGYVFTNLVNLGAEVAYPNEPCYWDSPDGTAPALQPGDEIYAVRGYATTFRLAARHDGEIVLYDVWCSDWAKVGADLFDIHGRVERIGVQQFPRQSPEQAMVDDRATVDALVEMLLAGRIIPEERAPGGSVSHVVHLYLDDRTVLIAGVAPGEFLWGVDSIVVPSEFTATLDRAWANHVALSGTPTAADAD